MLSIVYSAPNGQRGKRPDYITDMVCAMKFFAERIAGSDFFRRAFDALATPSNTRTDDVAALLSVSPATVRAWLTDKREPPRAAVIALWHESHLGRSETAAHSEYGALLARNYADTLARELRAADRTIETLRQELARAKMAAPDGRALAMNDPVIDLLRGPA